MASVTNLEINQKISLPNDEALNYSKTITLGVAKVAKAAFAALQRAFTGISAGYGLLFVIAAGTSFAKASPLGGFLCLVLSVCCFALSYLLPYHYKSFSLTDAEKSAVENMFPSTRKEAS